MRAIKTHKTAIAPMNQSDIPLVASFAHQLGDQECPGKHSFEEALEATEAAFHSDQWIGFVSSRGEVVSGCVFARRFKDDPKVWEIGNLFVTKLACRGTAQRLIVKVVETIIRHGARTLIVIKWNGAGVSHRFLDNLGFEKLKDYEYDGESGEVFHADACHVREKCFTRASRFEGN
jgi:hypothetical protein